MSAYEQSQQSDARSDALSSLERRPSGRGERSETYALIYIGDQLRLLNEELSELKRLIQER